MYVSSFFSSSARHVASAASARLFASRKRSRILHRSLSSRGSVILHLLLVLVDELVDAGLHRLDFDVGDRLLMEKDRSHCTHLLPPAPLGAAFDGSALLRLGGRLLGDLRRSLLRCR